MTTTTNAGRRLTTLDSGIIAAGAVAFVLAFFGYYTVSVRGVARTTGAWHGFFGWFAAVIALLAALVVVITFALPGRRRRPPYRIVLGLFAIATLSVLAALFTSGFDSSRAHGLGVAADTGHGYGYWLSLVAISVGTGLSLARVQQTGRRLPGVLGTLPNLGGARRER